MATHSFEAGLLWREGGRGDTVSNHLVEIDGKPPLEVSAAPQYRGDPRRLNPEEIFVAAVASCQLLTYLSLAARAGVRVTSYGDHATGTLALVERKMRMAEVVLHPRITVAAGADAAKAGALVDAAHEACFIANSVSCAVRIEPEIVVEGGA